MGFKRVISDNEWLYIRIQENFHQFNIQFVIAGEGRIFTDQLRKALDVSSANQPLSRSCKQGKYWVDTLKTPTVFEHSDIVDSTSILDHPVLQKSMPLENHTVEIHSFNGGQFFVFQIFHGVMDGKGALMFVRNTFKALNQTSLEILNFFETELAFIEPLEVHQKPFDFKFKYHGIEKYTNPSKGQFSFRRMSVNAEFPNLVPRLCQFFASLSKDSQSKWMIPVDIRRHRRGVVGDSNLTLPIFVYTHKGMTDKDIAGEYLFSLKENQEININNVKIWGVSFGGKFMGKLWAFALLSLQNISRKFAVSGLFSFLGKVNLRDFGTAEFEAKEMFAIPPYQPLTPFTLIVMSYEKRTELLISFSTKYVKSEKIEQYLDQLKREFEHDIF